ncbi:MAG: hypothetical protein ABIW76_03680 [Fibrobacteria bacterium]
MEIERVEIRPGMKLGLLLIGIGALDGLTETATRLAAEWGGTYGVWANKALCAVLIGFGIWNARKKIVVDNGAVLFSGMAKGQREAEVLVKDIESAGYEPGGKILAIKAKPGLLRVALARKTKSAADLIATLKDRGVKFSE